MPTPVPTSPPQKKNRVEARLIEAPAYEPDLTAYGLQRSGTDIVPIVACPDIEPAKAMRDPKVTIDARLWEGQFDKHGRLRESRVTDRLSRTDIEARYTRLRESAKLSESDWFSMGGSPLGFGGQNALTSNYVPLIPGPATRQQYWADYWASSAKCFEASTHSGIARRACKAMVNFPLSRGVAWKIKDQKAQAAWETFWKVNKMRSRFRQIAYDLSVFGEQFLRYFPQRQGLVIRQLDPATIYEIVTDQEDLETVFFYHQQFQTRMEMYSPPVSNRAPTGPTQTGVTRYIIRQIDYAEVDHYTVNVVSGEARGRSDLFPVLGDLKRMRDLLTSKVVQQDLLTRVMAILKANGTGADLNRVLNTIFPNGQPPAPGTIVALNEATDLQPFEYNASGVREDFTYEELTDSIVAGVGISRADLGLSPASGSGTTQSTALTSQTSGGKTYEERQELLDEILHDMKDRVMADAGINGEVDFEFIFPELAKEDRSAKLRDLEQSEANGWIAKKTAATQAASELGLGQYDYDAEMELIIAEFDLADDTDGTDEMGHDKPARGGKIRRPMIRASARQTPKLDPTKAQSSDDEPPGLIVGPDGQPIAAPGTQAPDQNAPPAGAPQKAAGGIPASKAPGTQNVKTREAAPAIRRTPEDPEFKQHVSEFEQATAGNLKQLIADLQE